jgi:hypothetical protein
MAVTPERARQMALALAGASEAPHFHRMAFKTPRKTFATLDPEARDVNLMFDPDHRDHFCDLDPAVFTPVSGGWGRMGATRCELDAVDESVLLSALQAAHRLAAPKARKAR